MNRRTLLRLTAPAALSTGLGALVAPLPATTLPATSDTLKLSPADSRAFVEALLNPPGPNQKLRDAAEFYSQSVNRGYARGLAETGAVVLFILRSNEFRCVAHERYFEISSNPLWDTRPNKFYDSRGRCMNVLTASIEREYKEMSSEILSSAIVFTGPCAEFHGYKDDTPNYHDLSARYLERKSLLKQVERELERA